MYQGDNGNGLPKRGRSLQIEKVTLEDELLILCLTLGRLYKKIRGLRKDNGEEGPDEHRFRESVRKGFLSRRLYAEVSQVSAKQHAEIYGLEMTHEERRELLESFAGTRKGPELKIPREKRSLRLNASVLEEELIALEFNLEQVFPEIILYRATNGENGPCKSTISKSLGNRYVSCELYADILWVIGELHVVQYERPMTREERVALIRRLSL